MPRTLVVHDAPGIQAEIECGVFRTGVGRSRYGRGDRAIDAWVDPLTTEVWRGEQPVELSRRELDVLETLLRADGSPVSKQILLDRVWGIDAEVDPNVVEVYIHYLRAKVDEPFGIKTILTQRGVGYRLVADTLW